MSIPLPLSVAIEKGVEALLRLDPETRQKLSALNDKTIRVTVTQPSLTLVLSVVNECVYVVGDADQVDTSITGSLKALRSLSDGNDALYRGEVRIEGDLAAGQQLKDVIASLDPDWEELVSPLLGDTLTHRLSTAAGEFSRWLDRTQSSFTQNTREYLQEEAELLAPNSEIKWFCNEVDELRAQADRLQARLSKLELTLAKQTPGEQTQGEQTQHKRIAGKQTLSSDSGDNA